MQQSSTPALAGAAARWNLLEHPFYRAWSEGTLPVETLARYSTEYGDFIRSVASAWETVGEPVIAAVETDHAALWDRFTTSMGAPVARASIPEVAGLCAEFQRLSAEPDTAIGALYAFEAQQPKVARSKLDGLESHYRSRVPAVSVDYFEAHVDDYAEPAILEARAAALDRAGRERMTAAADRIGRALWSALDGIYATAPVP